MAGALWLSLAVAGCPLREKDIRITGDGANWLVNACPRQIMLPPPPPGGGGGFPPGGGGSGGGPGGGPGPGGGGFGGSFPMDPNACNLDDHYPIGSLIGKTIEARLFLISPGDSRVQDASKCMGLHPCGDAGRSGSFAECMANDLNQQLDGAMPNGLGFDGLKNPEEAQLVLAFYQPSQGSDEGGGCHRADLFACAGLAAPLGGGAYDISCASCQGGSRTAPGNDTGPCPKGLSGTGSCFLKICDGYLETNGFE